MSNTLSSNVEVRLFVVPETTVGTIAYPSASHLVAFITPPDHDQTPEWMDNPEVWNTRSILTRCRLPWKAGKFSFDFQLHRSVTAGTIPNEGNVIEGIFGLETVTGSTSVEYAPSFSKGSYTIWIDYGHTAYYLSGAVFSEGKFSYVAAGSCYIKASTSGIFLRRGQTGIETIMTEYAGAGSGSQWGPIYISGNTPYHYGGCKVKFVSADRLTVDDNSGSGYILTGLEIAGADSGYGGGVGTYPFVYTTTAPGTIPVGYTMEPFLPDTSSVTPTPPIDAKTLEIDLDGDRLSVISFDVSIKDEIAVPDKEGTASGFPESYVLGTRAVTVDSIKGYFKTATSDFNYYAAKGGQHAVELKSITGTAAGSKLSILVPLVRFSSAKLALDGFIWSFEAKGSVEGSTGEDEIAVTYS